MTTSDTAIAAELTGMGLELQLLGRQVLEAIAARDDEGLQEVVARREKVLERIRDLAYRHADETAASEELREAARQEAQLEGAANRRLEEIRSELQGISQRIALRQTYSLSADEDWTV